LNTARLTNVDIYTAYIQLCVANMCSVRNYLVEAMINTWVDRFLMVSLFIHDLGYRLAGNDVLHLPFVK
jgi:hypothetical protein